MSDKDVKREKSQGQAVPRDDANALVMYLDLVVFKKVWENLIGVTLRPKKENDFISACLV